MRIGSLMVLARLLTPKDFGLVGMATAFTGIFNMLRDFGLSAAAVQQDTVTDDQISTLFWINLLFGLMFALLCIVLAPVIGTFYHQPRLVTVMAVLGLGFVFNAAGTQHAVLLQRQMRFTAYSTIGVVSLMISTGVAIGGALLGFGYWSLVALSVAPSFISAIGLWWTTGWIPGMPRRRAGVRPMIRFGGTMTLSGVLGYVSYNIEKVLLGRFWGAEALGIYGRSYQLVNMPTGNLNSAAGEVAFAALSRLQGDHGRLRSYFLKSFSLVQAVTVPITIACILFSGDLIAVFLGPKWKAAAPILRLLAPTIFAFGIMNPLGWLLDSTGLVGRGLKLALVFSPLIILGYFVGLPYGPHGVAFAYSTVMILWTLPNAALCVRGTVISLRDVLITTGKPLASGVAAGALAMAARMACGHALSPLLRLLVGNSVLFIAFFGILLFVGGQKSFYLDLLRGLRGLSPVKDDMVSV